MPSRIRLGLLAASLALVPGGCHRRAEDPAAVTPDEQGQLNDAAAMLDANGLTATADDADAPDDDTENAS